MPRQRSKENLGLPLRWRYRDGIYYYRVPPGQEYKWDGKKEFTLGDKTVTAYRVWLERIGDTEHKNASTINQLLDRYTLEVIPTKAVTTQNGNIYQIAELRRAFGSFYLNEVRPTTIYEYMDRRSAKRAGRLEVALLSHAFTKAVEWGQIDRHPFSYQLRKTKEKARTRYIEDWEIEECFKLPPKASGADATAFVQNYIRLKLLLGLRQGDMLRLRVTDFTEQGIPVTTSKTGKRVIFEWTPALRAAVEQAKAVRKVHISPWLFCTRRGESYVNEKTGDASGFKSIWQRFMARLLAETKITERFTEHDIRAKVGSDAVSDSSAQSLLTHDNLSTTRRAYRRRPEVITPLH